MMYNLLVRHDPYYGAWNRRNTYVIEKKRAFESSDEGKATSDYKDLQRRKELPCLFAYEQFGGTGQVGYIRSIRTQGKDVHLEYQLDTSFPPLPIPDERTYGRFGCEGFECFRTHWAVKDLDLFKVIARELLTQRRDLPDVSNSKLDELWGEGSRNCCRVFLSHRVEDRAGASDIANGLKEHGHRAFVAHDDIPPATEWRDQLLFALSTMTHFVGLVGDGFHQNSWTEQETGYAFARNDVKRIFVKLTGADPMGLAGFEQAAVSNWENAAHDICSLIDKF